MTKTAIRLGADIGGTFTDLVLEGPFGQHSCKVLTTYDAPEAAVIDGMHRVCALAGVTAGDISQVIHGTTLATNALIERRGAKTALITTQGFRDVIEMRTESRFEQYDLNLTLPLPLLPRNFRYTVEERMQADGQVLIPLDRAKVETLVDQIVAAGFASVAVGLLHSYVNDAHERLIADVLADRAPDIVVSLSCEVSPQMREYERFNTTIANAYIKPLMQSYLGRLGHRLAAEGAACPVFLMHSGGGIISLENAAAFPVRLVESGPAGGAVFAADIAARHGLDKVLSFDMGGTTAKICLIKHQTPKTARVFEVARTYRFKKGSGMPISIPVIDMVEIGAGGGSLAHVDALKQIRVGPESAGSDPGPACYGRGGGRAAVTDADLVLGRLDPDHFAADTLPLSPKAARDALQGHIGAALDMTAQDAALGIAEVVDENMANAARVHAVENGEDLSEYTMIAFGGAAPLHAGRLCEKLGIDRLLVPEGAGVGSAIGFLRAPFSFEATRSRYMRLDAFEADTVRDVLADLKADATGFVRSCALQAPITAAFKCYMRYAGQGWEIPVSLTAAQAAAPDANVLLSLFEAEYAALFSRTVAGMAVEITVWAVNATTPKPPVQQITGVTDISWQGAASMRDIVDPAGGKTVRAGVFARSALSAAHGVTGPAVIVENETTIIVPPSRQAVVLNDGTIEVRTP